MSSTVEPKSERSIARLQRDLARSLTRARGNESRRSAARPGIAVELSSYSLKAVYLDRGGRLHAYYYSVPREHHGDRAARARCLGETLRVLLREARATRFLCVLPSSRTRTAVVELPRLSDEDCAAALALKALKHLSGDPAEWQAHASPLRSDKPEAEGHRSFLLTLVEQQEMEELEMVFRHAGCIPSAVTTSCVVYPQLMPPDEPSATEETPEPAVWVLMELNRYTTSIHIYRHRQVAYSRLVQFGGENLTRALTDVVATEDGFVELSIEEAEAVKATVGYPHGAENPPLAGSRLLPEQIQMMLEPKLNTLIFELRSSIRFYQQQSGNRRIHRLVLTGGSSRLKGLDEYILSHLKLRPQRFAPADIQFATDDLTTDERERLFAEGASLLAALQADYVAQDLLPQHLRVERTTRAPFRIGVAALAAVLCAILVLGFSARRGTALGRRLGDLLLTSARSVPSLEELRTRSRTTDGRLRSLERHRGHRVPMGRFLADLARRTPPFVTLQQVSIRNQEGRAEAGIRGTLDRGATESPNPYQLLEEIFAGSPFVKECTTRSVSNGGSTEGDEFDVSCMLWVEAPASR